MVSNQNTQSATLLGLIAVIFWSTLPIVSIYTKGIPPFLCLSIAYFFAFIVHMIYWKYKYGSITLKFKQPLNYVLTYVIGIFSSNATFLIAMQHGDPVLSYLVSNLWPIFALFFAAFLFKEKLSNLHYIGAVIGFIGVIFISAKDGGMSMKGEVLFGFMMGFLNSVIWSFVSVINRKFSDIPADSVGLPLGIISILAFITHIFVEESTVISTQHLLAIMYLGIAPWGAAYTIWGYAVRFGDVKAVMLFGYLMPLLGVVWMILLGKAEFNMNVLISMILILVGASLGSIKLFLKNSK